MKIHLSDFRKVNWKDIFVVISYIIGVLAFIFFIILKLLSK